MPEKTVTSGAGVEKRVVADNQADLDAAVQAVEAETQPVGVDINVPVKKGHDLVDVDETSQTVGLSDGTGAHNSPRDAVNDDGSLEGDPEVPVVVGENTDSEPVVLEDEGKKKAKK